MGKRNKFSVDDNIDQEDYVLPASSEEVAEIEPEKILVLDHTELKSTPTHAEIIKAGFGDGIIEIGYVFLATGEQQLVSASNGRIHLLLGRMYYIPIGKTVDSDDYIIKIHSEAAARFDIRFIRDGFAAVVPLLHNSVLKTGEKLCMLIPLTI